jgi:hypothetical protein
MKTSNLVSETIRQSESGLCWEEKLTNAVGSVEVNRCSTFRVRSVAGTCTVTIDGVLAMTMVAGEVMLFNAGDGNPDDTKPTVTVTIGNSAAYLQVARETYRQKLNP